MDRFKNFLWVVLITLVIWAISRFAPGIVGALYPNSIVPKMAALITALPIGWIAAEKISRGRFGRCIRANLYIFAAIEALGILESLTYVLRNWSFTGRYTFDVNGIKYSDYPIIFGGVFLFEIVYAALCVYLAKRKTKATNAVQDSVSVSEAVETDIESMDTQEADKPSKQRYCKYCGGAIDGNTKKCTKCGKQYFRLKITKCTIFCAMLLVAVFVLSGANIYQYEKYQNACARLEHQIVELKSDIEGYEADVQDKTDKIKEYRQKITELEEDIRWMKWDISFYERSVAFVGDDGTRLYHKFYCENFDSSHFWAYNTEAAESRGYSPCPECH